MTWTKIDSLVKLSVVIFVVVYIFRKYGSPSYCKADLYILLWGERQCHFRLDSALLWSFGLLKMLLAERRANEKNVSLSLWPPLPREHVWLHLDIHCCGSCGDREDCMTFASHVCYLWHFLVYLDFKKNRFVIGTKQKQKNKRKSTFLQWIFISIFSTRIYTSIFFICSGLAFELT